MKKNKRRNYTDEFKEEAVKLVTEHHYKITEAARNLGIHHSLLRRWIRRVPLKVSLPPIRLFDPIEELGRFFLVQGPVKVFVRVQSQYYFRSNMGVVFYQNGVGEIREHSFL